MGLPIQKAPTYTTILPSSLFYRVEKYMFVCICHGVTDTQIESAIDDGAETMKQLSEKLKVGSQCGKCCQCTKRVLTKKLMQIGEAQPQVA